MTPTALLLVTALVGPVAAPPTTPSVVPSPAGTPTAARMGPALDRDTITLPEIFALLKKRSPRYKAFESQVDVAKSEVTAARVLPNPVLQLAILYLNAGFNQNGVATYYANATLPLLIAGQRRMRVKTAKVGVRSAEADLEASYHELAHEARGLFVELQADEERVRIYEDALADLARLQALISGRRGSGVETDYDILRIDVEASSWKARRAEEEAAAHDTAGRLGVLLGITDWYPEAAGDLALLGVRGDAKRVWPEVERTQPAIVAATRYEAYAGRNIDLAKRERWPTPAVTVGTVAIQNYYSISTQFGITVPLPVFDWGQGAIARAKARTRQARREKEAVIASTQAELARAMRLLEHHRRALETFDRDVLAKIPTLKQMAEDSYRAGGSQLIELLDATRTRFELQLTRIDLLEAAVHAEVDVLAVMGRIEDTVPR